MKTFYVQSIEINAPFQRTFQFIADPQNLPEWTEAFKKVSKDRATMETSAGTVDVGLKVESLSPAGTIDWHMSFPDGSGASAYSRVIDRGEQSVYSFVLTTPPVSLEQMEGALAQQSQILSRELQRLKQLLENGSQSLDA